MNFLKEMLRRKELKAAVISGLAILGVACTQSESDRSTVAAGQVPEKNQRPSTVAPLPTVFENPRTNVLPSPTPAREAPTLLPTVAPTEVPKPKIAGIMSWTFHDGKQTGGAKDPLSEYDSDVVAGVAVKLAGGEEAFKKYIEGLGLLPSATAIDVHVNGAEGTAANPIPTWLTVVGRDKDQKQHVIVLIPGYGDQKQGPFRRVENAATYLNDLIRGNVHAAYNSGGTLPDSIGVWRGGTLVAKTRSVRPDATITAFVPVADLQARQAVARVKDIAMETGEALPGGGAVFQLKDYTVTKGLKSGNVVLFSEKAGNYQIIPVTAGIADSSVWVDKFDVSTDGKITGVTEKGDTVYFINEWLNRWLFQKVEIPAEVTTEQVINILKNEVKSTGLKTVGFDQWGNQTTAGQMLDEITDGWARVMLEGKSFIEAPPSKIPPADRAVTYLTLAQRFALLRGGTIDFRPAKDEFDLVSAKWVDGKAVVDFPVGTNGLIGHALFMWIPPSGKPGFIVGDNGIRTKYWGQFSALALGDAVDNLTIQATDSQSGCRNGRLSTNVRAELYRSHGLMAARLGDPSVVNYNLVMQDEGTAFLLAPISEKVGTCSSDKNIRLEFPYSKALRELAARSKILPLY